MCRIPVTAVLFVRWRWSYQNAKCLWDIPLLSVERNATKFMGTTAYEGNGVDGSGRAGSSAIRTTLFLTAMVRREPQMG
jgi:hypothetical protein